MMNPVKKIAVTGAAGNISYSLLFKIASGDMLGNDQPISLRCLEITPALKALQGVVMELNDCAFPLLHEIIATDDVAVAYEDVDYALLVGARPRGPGMERGDLLAANGKIFTVQGKALNDYASCDAKVVVVGNPANTNAYITMHSAPKLNPKNCTALTRLDHNRAVHQLAIKTNSAVTDIKRVSIWGNHSATQYPDVFQATAKGQSVMGAIDKTWLTDTYIPTIAKRGAAIIDARGSSSAASAAKAIVDHVHDWVFGTGEGDWTSMAVVSDGSYGVEEGLIYSFPVICNNGNYQIVQNIEVSDFSRAYMKKTERELCEEREIVKSIIG